MTLWQSSFFLKLATLMNKISNLKRTRKSLKIVKILMDITTICTKHNAKYFPLLDFSRLETCQTILQKLGVLMVKIWTRFWI